MNKMVVFIAHYSINNSPSILNFLSFAVKHFQVDLYLHQCSLVEGVNKLSDQLRVIEIGRFYSYCLPVTRYLQKYDSNALFVCVDPHGLVLCHKMFPQAKPYYYSLELHLQNDHFGLYYPDDIAVSERHIVNNHIKGLIIQSREKERLFREDYSLSKNVPAFLLPVTGCGESTQGKSDYLYRKYSIDQSKKIALHLGGIAPWFSCHLLANVFAELSDWVLFFQGYADARYLEEMQTELRQRNVNNVIFGDELFATPELLSPILMSAHIGIAWYNDISAGFRTAGRSSGKIASYLQYGLPVITNTYPEMIDAIGNNECGVCISELQEITSAVAIINSNYQSYSINALNEYNQSYCFSKYEDALFAFFGDMDKN